MKNIKNTIAVFLLLFTVIACNEENWLKETALDIYSPENMFVDQEQLNSAIAKIYSDVAVANYGSRNNSALMVGGLADNLYHFYDPSFTNSNLYKQLVPEGDLPSFCWENFYKNIFDSNVILSRIEDVEFSSEKEKKALKAEAFFFRAYAYKNLAILFGGVPLILEEITEPKRDFVRASREDVLTQVISDLKFAAENLPDVTELKEDGRLTKAAASHVLTEVYLITKDWDNAISSATSVINNPNYSLMTERFGAWKDKPGDVFRDLFIRNNQNRHCAGGPNTEGIWVGQFEFNVPGGGRSPQGPRMYGIWYWSLTGKDGKNLFFGHSSQNGGRAFGFYANNDYLNHDIWEVDWEDMRNSEYNIRRDMVADNPASAYYGQKIVENNA
ncbi:MAG: RagB/SusD family nutrient uptake outer membrane protein, partial [Draconibacterium sp.]